MTRIDQALGVASLDALLKMGPSSVPPRVDGGVYFIAPTTTEPVRFRGRLAWYVAGSASDIDGDRVWFPRTPAGADVINEGRWILGVVGGTGFNTIENISSLAAAASAEFALDLGRSGIFTSFQATQPCWIVAYISAAARTADAARTITTDPLPGSGALFEVVALNSSEIFMTPIVSYGVATDVFFRVQNTGVSTQNIDVTIKGTRFN